MNISVFGLGYVGCVSAACIAKAGHSVIGVDTNEDKVAKIHGGISPIVEPGLEEMLLQGVTTGRLTATTSCEEAIRQTEAALVCVGTPGADNGQLNVETLAGVCRDIGRAIRSCEKDYTVIIRSTCLPGTIENVVWPALKEGAGGEFSTQVRVGINPEFIREGTALKDFIDPPLILAGCDDPHVENVIRTMFKGITAPFVRTEIRTAEMVKYVANAFHALKICFANEIGDMCSAVGADPQRVMQIFRMDRKLNISDTYLRPGFAFGGSCLPKDVRALLHAASRADVAMPVLSSVLPSNELQIRNAVDRIMKTRHRRIGIVGLSFKAGTDDLRESPMVTLVEMLIGKGCEVRILDRNVSIAKLIGTNRRYIEEVIPHISSLMCDKTSELMAHAEVLVIGNDGEEAMQVLEQRTPAQQVIDLTRGAIHAVVRDADKVYRYKQNKTGT